MKLTKDILTEGFGSRTLRVRRAPDAPASAPDVPVYEKAALKEAEDGDIVLQGGLQRSMQQLACNKFEYDGQVYSLLRSSERTKLSALPTNAQLQRLLAEKADVDKTYPLSGLKTYIFESVDSIADYDGEYDDGGEDSWVDTSSGVAYLTLYCGLRYEIDMAMLEYDFVSRQEQEQGGATQGREVAISFAPRLYNDVDSWINPGEGSAQWQLSFDYTERDMSLSFDGVTWAEEPVFTIGKRYVLTFTQELTGAIRGEYREYSQDGSSGSTRIVAGSGQLTWNLGAWYQGGTAVGEKIELVRIGNVVMLSGQVYKSDSISATTYNICTLPEEFRPSTEVIYQQRSVNTFSITQADGTIQQMYVSCLVHIQPGGRLQISRLSAGGVPCNYQANKRFLVAGMWLVD